MSKQFLKRLLYFGGIVILIVISLVYINQTYTYIYKHIDQIALKTPDSRLQYLVANNEVASSSLVYVALGDSLTAGVGANTYNESYPYQLAQYFAGNEYQVILKKWAVPGAKTQDVVNGLLDSTVKDQPDIITILIGVNDMHGDIDQVDFRKNYDFILRRLTEETKAKIYVINIPMIGSNKLLWPPYNYLFDRRTRGYNQIIAELTGKYSVKQIDLYTPTRDLLKKNGSHYAADFFHPSFQGYKIWADLIYASID